MGRSVLLVRKCWIGAGGKGRRRMGGGRLGRAVFGRVPFLIMLKEEIYCGLVLDHAMR